MNEHDALIDLGFTKMEAAVYIHLLSNPAQTGYAISKALGEAAPYIYRTLDSLKQKGAIISELGEKSVYRSVPYQELIAQMSRLYEERCNKAAKQLGRLQDIGGDNRIYSLTTVEQVYQRCRSMLSRCIGVAYLDIYPDPFSKLKDDIRSLHTDGKKVSLFLYEDTDIEVTRIVHMDPTRIVKHWKRQWIRIGIDGNEYLVALLNADGTKVYHALWSENPVLSWTQMYSLRSELQLAEIVQMLDNDAGLEELKQNLTDWRRSDSNRIPIGAQKIEDSFKGISG